MQTASSLLKSATAAATSVAATVLRAGGAGGGAGALDPATLPLPPARPPRTSGGSGSSETGGDGSDGAPVQGGPLRATGGSSAVETGTPGGGGMASPTPPSLADDTPLQREELIVLCQKLTRKAAKSERKAGVWRDACRDALEKLSTLVTVVEGLAALPLSHFLLQEDAAPGDAAPEASQSRVYTRVDPAHAPAFPFRGCDIDGDGLTVAVVQRIAPTAGGDAAAPPPPVPSNVVLPPAGSGGRGAEAGHEVDDDVEAAASVGATVTAAVHLMRLERDLASAVAQHEAAVSQLRRAHADELRACRTQWQEKVDAVVADATVRQGALLSQIMALEKEKRELAATVAEDRGRLEAATEWAHHSRALVWSSCTVVPAVVVVEARPTDDHLTAAAEMAALQDRLAGMTKSLSLAVAAREEMEAAHTDLIVRHRRCGATLREKEDTIDKLKARLAAAAAAVPPVDADAAADADSHGRLWKLQETFLKGTIRDLQAEVEAARLQALMPAGYDTVQWDFMRNVVLQFMALVNRAGGATAEGSQGVQRVLCSVLQFTEKEARNAGVVGPLHPLAPSGHTRTRGGGTASTVGTHDGSGASASSRRRDASTFSPLTRAPMAATMPPPPAATITMAHTRHPGHGGYGSVSTESAPTLGDQGPATLIGKPRRIPSSVIDGLELGNGELG